MQCLRILLPYFRQCVFLNLILSLILDVTYGRGVSCPTPIPPLNGTVKISSNGLTAAYHCDRGNTSVLVFCLSGKWSRPPPKCKENIFISANGTTNSEVNKEYRSSNDRKMRLRRSPNNGKYEVLRRNERVEQMVKHGLLTTTIESGTPTIVRVHPGDTAYLMCRVKNLGTNSVMWSGKGKVLTLDTTALVNKHRLFPSYDQATGTWLLEVRPVAPRDSGEYECRVNARRPLRHVVTLQVIPRGQPLLPRSNKASTQDELQVIRDNITALWGAVHDLQGEVITHLHGGHPEPNHHLILDQVETMVHEHGVHHEEVPHEKHSTHHDQTALQHLEDTHGHGDLHRHQPHHHDHHQHHHDHQHSGHHDQTPTTGSDDDDGDDDSHEHNDDHDSHEHDDDAHQHGSDHQDHQGHQEHGHHEHGHHEHGHHEHGHHEHDHHEHGHHEHDHHEHGHQEHGHQEHGHQEHGHQEHDHHEHGHQEHGHQEHGHQEHGQHEHDHHEHDHHEHGHQEHGHQEHGHHEHDHHEHGQHEEDHHEHGHHEHGHENHPGQDAHDYHGLHMHDHDHDLEGHDGHDDGHEHDHGHDDGHDHEHEHDHDHHDGHEHDHDHHDGHEHDHDHHDGHEHDHGHHDGHEHDHGHDDGQEHDHDHEQGHHDDHDHEQGHHDDHDHEQGHHGAHHNEINHHYNPHHDHHDDDRWFVSHCNIEPNAELSDADNIHGTIIISQRRDKRSAVFYDMTLSGFAKDGPSLHGFHVHENSVEKGKCSTAGSHYNPSNSVHGSLTSENRHLGDLSNIEVSKDGDFTGYIMVEGPAELAGPRDLVDRSIVIHALEDDLVSIGSAGGRLACCTIQNRNTDKVSDQRPKVEGRIRFNG